MARVEQTLGLGFVNVDERVSSSPLLLVFGTGSKSVLVHLLRVDQSTQSRGKGAQRLGVFLHESDAELPVGHGDVHLALQGWWDGSSRHKGHVMS